MTRALAYSVAFALAASVAGPVAQADPITLKLATLAPEGSAWMKLFHEWATNVEKRAPGAIKIKFYAGGVVGDERDAVRKMRQGQINGAAVTAVGLGLIQPEVRVLELPFLFKNYAELDHVRDSLDAEFRKKFEEKGYILLAWGDVGPVHLFTNVPVKTKADLMGTKMWAWVDDPVVRTLFNQLGLSGVPLGVPDVLPSLQTGLINACYASPLVAVALQWQSKVKYITSMIISQSVGATVLTKKVWESLTPDLQAIVMDESRKLSAKTVKQVRSDNDSSLRKMQEQGLQLVPTPTALSAEFETQANQVRTKLDGQLYTKEFRQRVEALVTSFRGGK